MSETEFSLPKRARQKYWHWLPHIIFFPRRCLAEITDKTEGVWLTPLFVFSVTTTILSFVQGWLRQLAMSAGEITYPPGFEYYTPEQQAQFQQAMQATSSPVFSYVLPTIWALIGIWVGWLLVGGMIHLITTMLGGRGSTAVSLNVVAWSSVPFILRDVVQIIYQLFSRQLIQSAGLSGFVATDESLYSLFLNELFSHIDIYLIWHFLLVVFGIHMAMKIRMSKSIIGVLIGLLLVISGQAFLSLLLHQFSNLTVTRPFFF
jgi:hypothetical protein